MEYQRIAAAGLFPVLSTVPPLRGFLERCWCGMGGLVFGTLLGPEATGPGLSWFLAAAGLVRVCFWFPGCTDHACLCVWGVWFGVVV